MAVYDYVATSGVIVPDTAEIRSDVEREWIAAFGAIDTSAHTPQGVMIVAETLAREALVNNNAQVANQINPNQSGGVFLDALCALMGLERRNADPSSMLVTLYGVINTMVPQGTQFRDVSGNIWTSTQGAELGPYPVFGGDGGSAENVPVVCDRVGPIPCGVGELTEIYTPVLGLERVYNPTSATLGYAEESDIELSQRRRVTLARQGISTAEAQISALYDLQGVTGVAFRENISNVAQTIDGVLLGPKSIWACVDGGGQDAVAKALWINKTAGASFNGAQTVAVLDPHSEQVVNVQFDRPTHISVTVEITGRMMGDQSVNPLVEIPAAVVAWAAGQMSGDPGLGIGVDVSPYEVGGAINRVVPGFHVSAMTLRREGTAVPVSVPIGLKERAVIELGDVTVSLTQ